MTMLNNCVKKCTYLSLAGVIVGRRFVLWCGLLLSREDHGSVTNTYQSSLERRRQRTACLVLVMMITSCVDTENVDENDRQTDDK